MQVHCLQRRQGVHCNPFVVGNLTCMERVSCVLPALPLLVNSLSMGMNPLCRAFGHCFMHSKTPKFTIVFLL